MTNTHTILLKILTPALKLFDDIYLNFDRLAILLSYLLGSSLNLLCTYSMGRRHGDLHCAKLL